jgi:hypothetical protein
MTEAAKKLQKCLVKSIKQMYYYRQNDNYTIDTEDDFSNDVTVKCCSKKCSKKYPKNKLINPPWTKVRGYLLCQNCFNRIKLKREKEGKPEKGIIKYAQCTLCRNEVNNQTLKMPPWSNARGYRICPDCHERLTESNKKIKCGLCKNFTDKKDLISADWVITKKYKLCPKCHKRVRAKND